MSAPPPPPALSPFSSLPLSPALSVSLPPGVPPPSREYAPPASRHLVSPFRVPHFQVRRTFFTGAPFGCVQSVAQFFGSRAPLLPNTPVENLLTPGSVTLSDSAGNLFSVHPGRRSASANYAQLGQVWWQDNFSAAGIPPLATSVPSISYRYGGGSVQTDLTVFQPLYLLLAGGLTVAYPTFSIGTGGIQVPFGDWVRSCPLVYTTYPSPAPNCQTPQARGHPAD